MFPVFRFWRQQPYLKLANRFSEVRHAVEVGEMTDADGLERVALYNDDDDAVRCVAETQLARFFVEGFFFVAKKQKVNMTSDG